jgi:hypothetical protein
MGIHNQSSFRKILLVSLAALPIIGLLGPQLHSDVQQIANKCPSVKSELESDGSVRCRLVRRATRPQRGRLASEVDREACRRPDRPIDSRREAWICGVEIIIHRARRRFAEPRPVTGNLSWRLQSWSGIASRPEASVLRSQALSRATFGCRRNKHARSLDLRSKQIYRHWSLRAGVLETLLLWAKGTHCIFDPRRESETDGDRSIPPCWVLGRWRMKSDREVVGLHLRAGFAGSRCDHP